MIYFIIETFVIFLKILKVTDLWDSFEIEHCFFFFLFFAGRLISLGGTDCSVSLLKVFKCSNNVIGPTNSTGTFWETW